MYATCAEILAELDTPWMGVAAPPRQYGNDETSPLIHLYAGTRAPNYQFQIGAALSSYLIEAAGKIYPDVPLSDFGFITVDHLYMSEGTERRRGTLDTLTHLAPEFINEGRYFPLNTFYIEKSAPASYLAYSYVTETVTNNPDIYYWLVACQKYEFGEAAAYVFAEMELGDRAIIVAFHDGFGLPNQWDPLDDRKLTSFKAVYTSPSAEISVEPVIGALYALMNGDATPETLWTEWVFEDENQVESGYASRPIPLFWLDRDSYQRILKWSDIYARNNNYPDYLADGITRDTFSTYMQVPDTGNP
jgi:hypothetical protein